VTADRTAVAGPAVGSPGGEEGGLPPRLGARHWPADAYDRSALPERLLVFGTGMLLRSLPLALLDDANRAGRAAGRAVLVQSTGGGNAEAFGAQEGLYALVERGLADGAPVERARLVGAVSRALDARRDWAAVRAAAATPALRVVVSNVTEAGFRAHPADGHAAADDAAGRAPEGFVGKLVALLHARYRVLGAAAPPLHLIPTELVDDNGAALAALLDDAARGWPGGAGFRAWMDARVRVHASLVDRITTDGGPPAARAALQRALGVRDALLTVAEPYALWAVEGDPAELRAVLPADDGERALFAPSIARYRERKLRLLNGAHSALAPLALLAGLTTVYDATRDAAFAPLLRRLLLDELAPATTLRPDEARAFALTVLDRFANPSLEHAWRVIAANQTAKLRLRVVPALRAWGARGAAPPALALGLAAALRLARDADAAGRDPEAPRIAAHWAAAGSGAPAAGGPAARVAARALADQSLWGAGAPLATVPGLVDAVSAALDRLLRDGPVAAVAAALAASAAGEPA
jgi:tagaturonate reductase